MAKSSGSAKRAHDANKGFRHPKPVDIHVGGRLRLRRMRLGMSQVQLGEKVGITFQQVQKYEKGTNRIGASRLFEIAHVLSVPVQFFYEEAPSMPRRPFDESDQADKPSENSIIEFLRSREGLELNSAFARISHARTRRAIVELVRNLAN